MLSTNLGHVVRIANNIRRTVEALAVLGVVLAPLFAPAAPAPSVEVPPPWTVERSGGLDV